MADFKPAEAAQELGISRGLLYQLCASGQIPHQRYGAPGSRKPRITFTERQLDEIRRMFEQKTMGRRLRRAS